MATLADLLSALSSDSAPPGLDAHVDGDKTVHYSDHGVQMTLDAFNKAGIEPVELKISLPVPFWMMLIGMLSVLDDGPGIATAVCVDITNGLHRFAHPEGHAEQDDTPNPNPYL